MLKGFYLTVMVGAVRPQPLPRVALEALTSIQVTSRSFNPNPPEYEGEPMGDVFQLTFNLSNRSPLQTLFLIASGVTPLLRVIITITINGAPNVLMDGVITNQELTPGSKPGESTLTITGEDLTKVMTLNDVSGIPYPSLPPEGRVTLIVAKYLVFGIVPLVIPTIVADIAVPVERFPIHEGTDLGYIEELAWDVGYVFYLDPGPKPGFSTFYWGPEIKVGAPQPALNLDMDAHTNVETLSFNFNTANTILPIVYIQNPITKTPIPIPIPKLNPLQPPLGLIQAPITNIARLKETAKLSPMAAISRGLAVSSKSLDAVSATGTLDAVRYGRLLQARKLVGVRGAGMAFDGLYYVKSVTTNIKQGELKQNFELSRNGLVSTTPRVPA